MNEAGCLDDSMFTKNSKMLELAGFKRDRGMGYPTMSDDNYRWCTFLRIGEHCTYLPTYLLSFLPRDNLDVHLVSSNRSRLLLLSLLQEMG